MITSPHRVKATRQEKHKDLTDLISKTANQSVKSVRSAKLHRELFIFCSYLKMRVIYSIKYFKRVTDSTDFTDLFSRSMRVG